VNSKRPLLPGDGPLARVRPVVAFLVVLALFITGVFVGGTVGAVLLGVLVLGATALLAATWRILSPAQRMLRVVVLLVLVIIALELVLKIPTR
jgi:energy-coupling factor transporter transmembrane protein EcfT